MPISAEELIERILDCGLLSRQRLDSFLAQLEDARQGRGGSLARLMVEAGLLTEYQSQRMLAGRMRGMVLDTYVVLEQLGVGGMGQVFKALHRRMDRVVALKVLRERVLDSPEAIDRFHREVKAAARLVHPNIVTAYDADEEDGIHFLVMEYVEGRDLADLVAEQPMAPQTAADYILQAANGLEYAHAQGVVHRDVKPSNLLLDRHGTIKILDMGIARIDERCQSDHLDQTAAMLTGDGIIIGTVDFLAPEQAVNAKRADARSDIYSLGCTLYYLLAGEPVYAGETMVEKIMAHRIERVPSLWEIRPDVPAALDMIIQRMMAKDPQERFQTMNEVIAALEQLDDLAGRKETKSGPTPSDAAPAGEIQAGDQRESSQPDKETPKVDASALEKPHREPAEEKPVGSEALSSLERYIDGCGGPDHFLDVQEEQAIFRKGGDLGLTLTQVERALAMRCHDGSWTRQTKLTETLSEMLKQAAGDDGSVDQKEYQQVIDFAVKRKMPRKAAEEHCITLMLDNAWRAKQSFFNRWFDKKREQHGLH